MHGYKRANSSLITLPTAHRTTHFFQEPYRTMTSVTVRSTLKALTVMVLMLIVQGAPVSLSAEHGTGAVVASSGITNMKLGSTIRASLSDIRKARQAAQQAANRLTIDSIRNDRRKMLEQIRNHIIQSRMEAIADAAKKQAAAANAFNFN